MVSTFALTLSIIFLFFSYFSWSAVIDFSIFLLTSLKLIASIAFFSARGVELPFYSLVSFVIISLILSTRKGRLH